MKKLAAVLLAAASFLVLDNPLAQAGMYISGNLVAVDLDDSSLSSGYDDGFGNTDLTFDNGFGFAAALGYAADNGFRVEGELAGRFNEMDSLGNHAYDFFDDGYVSALSLMANAYYNFLPDSAVSPFVGAGIGLVNVEADFDYDFDDYDDDYYHDDYDDSDYDTVLAYQLAAGVSFAVTHHLKVDLQYRYFKTDDPDFDGIEIDYKTQNAMLGLRYNF